MKQLISGIGLWAGRLFLIISGILAGILLIELVARQAPGLVLPGAIRTYSELTRLQEEDRASRDQKNIYTALPKQQIDQMGTPGLEYTHYGLDFTTQVAYNSLGIRDREPSTLTPDRPTMLLLGDSFVEGREVAVELTMARQIEQQLEAQGSKWWVVNAGVSGTGPINALYLLEYLGPIYQPRKVVLIFFIGNDLRNNNLLLNYFFGEAAYRIVLDTAQPTLLTRRGFYWKLDGEETFQYIKRSSRLDQILEDDQYRWLQTQLQFIDRCKASREANSVASKFLPWIADSSEAYKLLQHRLDMDIRTNCLLLEGIPPDFLFYTNNLLQLQEVSWEVTAYVLTRMHTIAKEQGADFLVVILPDQVQVNEVKREHILKKYNIPEASLAEVSPQERLVKILNALGIPSVDLTEAFKRHNNVNELYLPIDPHLSPSGQRFVAEQIVKALLPE